MSKTLTNKDYCAAAEILNCEPAAIKAVASVESAGGGFLPDGRVKILFERHHFSRLTKRVFDAKYPQISNRKPGGYFGGESEYARFNQAFALDPVAAMMSTSWGKFQIMGFNYAACGFTSIHHFVDAMKISEGEQLKAFCGFVETNNLDDELRRRDWAGFARGYNGKNYRINKYDEKMAAAYARFRAEKIDCRQFLTLPISEKEADALLEVFPGEADAQIYESNKNPAAEQNASSLENPKVEPAPPPEKPSFSERIGQINEQIKNGVETFNQAKEAVLEVKEAIPVSAPADPTVKVTSGKSTAFYTQMFAAVLSFFGAVLGFLKDNWLLIAVGIIGVVLIAVAVGWIFAYINKLKMQIAADPTKYNVE